LDKAFILADAEKIDEALELCNKVLELEPDYEDAIELKKELQSLF